MNDKMLGLIPVFVALLACKQGERAPTEAEREPAPPSSAAAPDFDLAAAKKPGAHSAAVVLPVTAGKVREQNGFLVIPGEVKNDTSSWLRSVRVDIQLIAADGTPVTVNSILAADGIPEGVVSERGLIPPGEVGVFRYTRDLAKLSRPYASYKLRAKGRVTDDRMSASVNDVTTQKDEIGFTTVSGKLESTGAEGCRSPHAVIALYAADGKLWDVRTSDIDDWFQKVMPRGQAKAFSRRAIDGRAGEFRSIKVWGDCRP